MNRAAAFAPCLLAGSLLALLPGCGPSIARQEQDAREMLLTLFRAILAKDDPAAFRCIAGRECLGSDNPNAIDAWDKAGPEEREKEMKRHVKWIRSALQDAGIMTVADVPRLDTALRVVINSGVRGTGFATFTIAEAKRKPKEVVNFKLLRRDVGWLINNYDRKFQR